MSYADVLQGSKVGRRVAVVGAGGIGFDVAEFVSHLHAVSLSEGAETFQGATAYDNDQKIPASMDDTEVQNFLEEWGIDGKVWAILLGLHSFF